MCVSAKRDTARGPTAAPPALTTSRRPRARSVAVRFLHKDEEPVSPEWCVPPLEGTSHAQPLPGSFFSEGERIPRRRQRQGWKAKCEEISMATIWYIHWQKIAPLL